MKQKIQTIAIILLALLLCFADNLMSQNGGQSPQNTLLQFKAVSKDSLQAKNISACKVDFRTEDNRAFTLNAGDSLRMVANAATKVKATKVYGKCNGDHGWVEAGKLLAGCVTLPVTWGELSATRSSSKVTIKWSTITETDVKEFIPQISEDGNKWVDLEAVKPNASKAYSYTFDINAGAFMASIALIFMVGFKRRKLLLLLAPIIIISMFSCSKNGAIVERENQALFVRIKQVDINGTANYSKIVRVLG